MPKEKHYAVVVGISHYPGYEDVAGPVEDARDFLHWLRDPAGGDLPGDNIGYLLSSAPETSGSGGDPDGARPTAPEIDALFEPLWEQGLNSRVGERLYIFVAGHGISDPRDLRTSALLPADVTPTRLTAVGMVRRAEWFRRHAAFDEIVLFADCCRSQLGHEVPDPPWKDGRQGRGAHPRVPRVRYLYGLATGYGQLAYLGRFGDKGQRGVFSQTLLRALREAQPDDAGRVTGEGLRNHIHNTHDRVAEEGKISAPVPPPDFEAEHEGELVFSQATASGIPRVSASSDALVALSVRAADAATEIFLVDAGFRRRAKAVGELNTRIAPGIYKLRFRAALTQVDRLIEVEPGKETRIEQAPVPFFTAIPLAATADANPDRQRFIQAVTAGPVRRSAGTGARLCVFARDTLPGPVREWRGLTIGRLDGARIADIAAASAEAASGMVSLSLELDPGIYRLRVAAAHSPPHECFLPLVRGWQTLVFMLADEPQGGKPRVRIPRFADASVAMLRLGEAFDPASAALRLTEQLRYSLEGDRAVLTDTVITDTLDAAPNHPLLALYAAHLLLREHPTDRFIIEHILTDLQASLGALPDVEALLLRSGAGTPPAGLRFETPPLLRASWNLIAAASRDNMDLVPPGSLSAQVREALVIHPLWLLSGRLGAADEPTGDAG